MTPGKISALTLSIVLASPLSACMGSKKLVQVGRFAITEEYADFRNQLIRLSYPQEKRDLGAHQLTQAYTAAEILIQNGHDIDEKTLDREETRIDTHTKDPATLAKIKAIFGTDKKAYRQVFILPTYAERTIYFDFFLKNPKIQEMSRQHAVDFFNSIQNDPAQIVSKAKEAELQYATLFISKESGMKWTHPGEKKGTGNENDLGAQKIVDQSPNTAKRAIMEKRLKEQMETAAQTETLRWLSDVVAPTRPGELFSNIVDGGSQWIVVRNLGFNKKHKAHELQAVFFSKVNYEEWLRAEKTKVKIENFS